MDLEIAKGKPVPKLREYISSNTFIKSAARCLSADIGREWSDALTKEGIRTSKMEGLAYYKKLLDFIRYKYMAIENASEVTPSDESRKNAVETKPKKERSRKKKKSPTRSVSSSSGSPSPSPKTMSATSSPKKPAKKDNNSQQKSGGNGKPMSQLQRWTCPVVGHDNHLMRNCVEFFELGPQEKIGRAHV